MIGERPSFLVSNNQRHFTFRSKYEYARLIMFQFAAFILFASVLAVLATYEIEIRERENEINLPQDAACVARYVIHNSDWCSISVISQNATTYGMPTARVYSISDGITGKSTGTVYFMISPMDLTAQDLLKKSNCSIVVSLAEKNYCTKKRYDPQDPRCAQVILGGNFVKINQNESDFDYAKQALWTRHPIMKYWFVNVPGHKWFFAKIDIDVIQVVDAFGGRKFPSVEAYFNKTCDPTAKPNSSASFKGVTVNVDNK